MRRLPLLPIVYLAACVGFTLRAILSTLPGSERWLTVQGLTFPWGICLSYLPGRFDLSVLAQAALYLTAATLNAWLLLVIPRVLGALIRRVESLDDFAD